MLKLAFLSESRDFQLRKHHRDLGLGLLSPVVLLAINIWDQNSTC